jgi:hypothetical protein
MQVHGQVDSCWTVLLAKEGREVVVDSLQPGSFNADGFYLYRNCIYDYSLKNQMRYSGRLVDISPDTLYFTNFFNESVAARSSQMLDTMAIHFSQLDVFHLIADRSMGLYENHSLDGFNFHFSRDTTHCMLSSMWYPIFSNDTSTYELAPHLTAQGVELLFEDGGRTFFYYGSGMVKPDRSQMDTTYNVRRVAWYTPCSVEEIHGLAIGLYHRNLKNSMFIERDSLVIRGVAAEINPFGIFILLSPRFNGPLPDSLEYYLSHLKNNWMLKVHGLNLSLVNTIGETEIRGVNITPAITLVDELHGLSISGINNFSYIMRGVTIAAIRNRATDAKGVQIGLFNKATNLRGVQIGLWNTNGKRSLPLVNWQFAE